MDLGRDWKLATPSSPWDSRVHSGAKVQERKRRGQPEKTANSLCREVGVVTTKVPPRFGSDPSWKNWTSA